MNISIHNSLTAPLKKEWMGLWEKSAYANIANSPEWFEAALQTYKYKSVRIITAHNDSGELAAVLPLVLEKKFGLGVFAPPAAEFADHCALLGNRGDKSLAESIVSGMLALGTSYITGLGKNEAGIFTSSDNKSIIFPSDEEFFMDFTQGELGKINRKKIKNSLNRINNSDKKANTIIESGASKSALENCFEIDKASVKQRQGRGVFWRKDARLFYSLLSEKLPENVLIQIFSFDNKPAAYWLYFKLKNNYIASQKAYLSGYEYYNLGFVTFVNFLEFLNGEGSDEISLGKGRDRFKTDFTDQSCQLYTAVLSKNVFSRNFLSALLRFRENAYRAAAKRPKFYRGFKELKKLLISHE